MANKAISGASCKVYLSATGQEVGWATGVDVTESIQTQRVDIIGELDSQEIVPVRRTAQMTVNAIRIQRNPLEAYGAWNIGDSQDVINAPALDFVIIDDNTGETLILLEGCKPTTRAFRVDSQSLFSENLSFEIRRLKYPTE